jgi:molybdopterin synthase catalytic subunit
MSSTADWIAITPGPLSLSDAVAFVADDRAGAIDLFLGTTRSEQHPETKLPLVALDYEAYGEMALPQLQTLAAAARSQWPVLKLAILHRIGRVPLSQPSVLVAVSTPHRAEAFAACQFLITALKADVAIWKKEVWADGSGRWVHPEERSQ